MQDPHAAKGGNDHVQLGQGKANGHPVELVGEQEGQVGHREAEPGQDVGSVFSFDLVQGIRNYEPVGDISEKISRQATEYSYTPAFVAPEAKILVVDDIEVNRYVVRNLLKQTKIQIFDADCGAKCLQMIQEQHFDLIFLDHIPPHFFCFLTHFFVPHLSVIL